MSILRKFWLVLWFAVSISGCKTEITGDTTTTSTTETSSNLFASGTKAVKILTANLAAASFDTPTTTPTPTVIPSPFPGADGTTTYRPGVPAARFYSLDGATQITKPDWLKDFQLGITSTTYSASCASFGGGVSALDPINQYRVSEYNCSTTSSPSIALGTGSPSNDQVFFRIILDRDNLKLGTAENLLVQVEYQASGLHFNSDGTSTNAEDNQDLLWKIYWDSSLASTSMKTFGVFVPPIYSACDPAGVGTTAAPGSCSTTASNNYRGSPIKVRQFIIPLAAYPDMKVIQFSRIRSRINQSSAYVNSFCGSGDNPLCLGVVIRSVSIMRI